MPKTFSAQLKFSLNKKDKELYQKYGVPAIELADDGEFLAAVKLLDKVIKENPKSEFALLLKANYMFNHINETYHIDGASYENLPKIKTQVNGIKKILNDCISLLDSVIEINPKNNDAKKFKDFISNNSLKEVEKTLEAVEATDKQVDISIECPYCHEASTLKGGIQGREVEIECGFCNKIFKYITGKVSVVRGHPNRVVQFGAEPISITLQLKDKQVNINFQTHFRFLIRKGDIVSFIYLAKLWSQSFKENPSYIYNWSSEEIFKIS